jgi:hypothetical protein
MTGGGTVRVDTDGLHAVPAPRRATPGPSTEESEERKARTPLALVELQAGQNACASKELQAMLRVTTHNRRHMSAARAASDAARTLLTSSGSTPGSFSMWSVGRGRAQARRADPARTAGDVARIHV